MSTSPAEFTPTRPYLLRALHDWCTDNGFTPYLAVHVDETVRVPMEYVKNNEIVLNCGFEATSGLKLGNEFVEFKARFGGVPREIMVPVDHVVAIYARENGQGMAFPMPVLPSAQGAHGAPGPHGGAPSHVGLVAVAPAVGAMPTGATSVSARNLRLAPSVSAPAAVDPTGSLDSAAQGSPSQAPMPAHDDGDDPHPLPPAPPGGSRPSLKRVK